MASHLLENILLEMYSTFALPSHFCLANPANGRLLFQALITSLTVDV